MVKNEPFDAGSGGGGTTAEQKIVKLCPPQLNAQSPEEGTEYRVMFSEGVEGPYDDIEDPDRVVDENTVRGQFGNRCDVWEGYGEVTVENLGVPETHEIPVPMVVTINGKEIGDVEPGQAATVQDGEFVNRRSVDSDGSTSSGDLLSGLPVPGILPSIGPLSSEMTTLLAGLLAVGVALSVVQG
jgi:hypothetical protein